MNTPHLHLRRRIAAAVCVSFAALSCALAPFQPAHAQGIVQFDIPGPPGSGEFGWVTVLPNGNFVVTDPLYDEGSAYDVGAVYLYDGATLEIISTLKGSTTGDRVGSNVWPVRGVTVLANGNYVVRSPYWNDSRGAVTWGSAETGFGAPEVAVSAANSLVGSTAGDGVGYPNVTTLPNGAYVVRSPGWDDGATEDVGAVTWSGGAPGLSGPVSTANSLVGSTAYDQIGYNPAVFLDSMTVLANGNYVVRSPSWDNGTAVDAGAVTWGSAANGVRGVVSAANSLVGTAPDDRIGFDEYVDAVQALPNGNYVVFSRFWNNGAAENAGAVTWGDGATGVSGEVSAANSLVGSAPFDSVGNIAGWGGLTVLASGNFVVANGSWHDMRGAATWINGQTGIRGEVSAANSLVGSAPGDTTDAMIIVVALTNGNYVVSMPEWNAKRGAVTWGSGADGVKGIVSAANSLVGAAPGERVGSHGVVALSNGNYVVGSPNWGGGRGAATWADGETAILGSASAANSLVGSAAGDAVGIHQVALTNGNYVVTSYYWDGGRGAVTWGDGTTGARGEVSAMNSLVGSTPGDAVGTDIEELANGNYVVASIGWNEQRGSATWASGTTGSSGVVSPANSLVGSLPGDLLGFRAIALTNGNYVVTSSGWSEGFGTVTWGSGATGIHGEATSANSLTGSAGYGDVGNYVTPLANGNYVVTSPYWNDQGGAVTWGSGVSGVSGEISAVNSLVGSTPYDRVGWGQPAANVSELMALPDGNYLVGSSSWDNGEIVDAGAFTWGDGKTGVTGAVSKVNSVMGETANGGSRMHAAVNEVHKLLIVGRPADNVVTVAPLDFGRMLLTLIIRLEEQPGR